MKRIFTVTITLCTLAIPAHKAVAQVYTCTVGDRKVYQSTPCKAGDKPVEMYVPPAPKSTQQHGTNDHVQEYLHRRSVEQQRKNSIVDQRAREARNSRLQKEQAEAEKHRIDRAIFNDQIVVGMTKEDVLDSWGKPTKINDGMNEHGTYSQWVYRKRNSVEADYVYFRNGKVTGQN